MRVGTASKVGAALAGAALVVGSGATRVPATHIASATARPVNAVRILHQTGRAWSSTSKALVEARRLANALPPRRAERIGEPAIPTAPTTLIPTDPFWSQQWGLSLVSAPGAWRVSAGSKPIIVAVLDSGVDPTQPDLQGALVPGADFVDAMGDTTDRFGHGTMVAGVIAARPDNGLGGAGACWTCLVMPIKVLGDDGTGTAPAIAAGIRYAADHGAAVISMSFVLSGPDDGVAQALAYAHDRGVLLVAAAGNNGNDAQTYPASYPGVISVAAVDQTGALYPWSTYGSWVTLAAPGCLVTTAPGAAFVSFCGTSASAPLVAGLAGLALSAGAASPAAVEAALEQTASPLPTGAVGNGRVDALALIQRAAAH